MQAEQAFHVPEHYSFQKIYRATFVYLVCIFYALYLGRFQPQAGSTSVEGTSTLGTALIYTCAGTASLPFWRKAWAEIFRLGKISPTLARTEPWFWVPRCSHVYQIPKMHVYRKLFSWYTDIFASKYINNKILPKRANVEAIYVYFSLLNVFIRHHMWFNL